MLKDPGVADCVHNGLKLPESSERLQATREYSVAPATECGRGVVPHIAIKALRP